MTSAPGTIRVFIPLTIKRRNGRPRILSPANMETAEPRTRDRQVLRAITCAWGWRRKIESDEVATIRDIAVAQNVSERFVSRTMRLAYLSPIVLEKLVARHRPCSLSIKVSSPQPSVRGVSKRLCVRELIRRSQIAARIALAAFAKDRGLPLLGCWGKA
jgi:hypothetical protein